MTGIAIYMEGGGHGKDGRAALRQGMDAFLAEAKQEARARAWRWRLVCSGGRSEAFRRFRAAFRRREAAIVMLLVDAEDALSDASPRDHLCRRDGWDLDFAEDWSIHLMTQIMEAWIVADPDALAGYYGQRFRRSALPNAADLETVPKHDVESTLDEATRATSKGAYHKIRHARDLLTKIDPARARERCAGCTRMFSVFDDLFAGRIRLASTSSRQ